MLCRTTASRFFIHANQHHQRISHPILVRMEQTSKPGIATSSNPKNRLNPNAGPNAHKNQKRGGKLRGQERDSPEVRLSKTLSWILRHGAKGEGLKMRPDGYVKVTDLVRSRSLRIMSQHLYGCVVFLAGESEVRVIGLGGVAGDREGGLETAI